jgi:predicted esterase
MAGEVITRRAFTFSLASALRAAPKHNGDPNHFGARPGISSSAAPPGVYQLRLRTTRDSVLYIPDAAAKKPNTPLVISLHGASGSAERGIKLLRGPADEFGFLLLAPSSADGTWDLIKDRGGPDVGFIDQSLARTFQVRTVDPARIAIAGISDGGSCSLGLGLINGDFFSAVLAFSPGFLPHGKRTGKPAIFISHGTKDTVLPIDETSRRIVPRLKHDGYRVTYREFDGRHTLPPEIASEAMQWFMRL